MRERARKTRKTNRPEGASGRRKSWIRGAFAVGVAVSLGCAAAMVMTARDDREPIDRPRAATAPRPSNHPPTHTSNGPSSSKRLGVRVVRRLPHDRSAFTQGLLAHTDGRIFESTGLVGHSTLREVELETGRVLRKIKVGDRLFAEGLARVGDRLWLLTWRDGSALEYRLEDFALLRRVRYQGEGWGLCFDGERLVMSNGTPVLTFRDPLSFDVVGTVEVTRAGRPLPNLNELECVGRLVYANVWQTEEIVVIDPSTGEVSVTIDASGLLSPRQRQGTDVLNGIAYLPKSGHFLITGKRWPLAFEVVFDAR